jgi:transposase InsO family protein
LRSSRTIQNLSTHHPRPFIRILQREWAYGLIYPSSSHRAKALPDWLRWYNNHRPHGGIDGHPPITRISQAARSYT